MWRGFVIAGRLGDPRQALLAFGLTVAFAAGIVIWLAVVNTAFAFTLWNHTLRTLSAVESSIINNTMLVQIALLAWAFLGEPLTERQIAGMIVAGLGTLGLVVGKLFLVDLERLDAIWRILLFMGFGVIFLMLSYFFQKLWQGKATDSA